MNLSSAERERLRKDPPPHLAFVTTEALLYAASPHCVPEATPEEIVEALGRAAFSMILDSPHDGATMDVKWMDGSVALTLGVFVVREVRFGSFCGPLVVMMLANCPVEHQREPAVLVAVEDGHRRLAYPTWSIENLCDALRLEEDS
ncbi:hypothetical protein [Dokdonella immobilis]|uniref:hypothetical protein n=1 Tax=Dokdonella immobilis TaxID=578942 RepID=UPI0011142B06|nr:hypothetical protein [Dokdonella immobilis]